LLDWEETRDDILSELMDFLVDKVPDRTGKPVGMKGWKRLDVREKVMEAIEVENEEEALKERERLLKIVLESFEARDIALWLTIKDLFEGTRVPRRRLIEDYLEAIGLTKLRTYFKERIGLPTYNKFIKAMKELGYTEMQALKTLARYKLTKKILSPKEA